MAVERAFSNCTLKNTNLPWNSLTISLNNNISKNQRFWKGLLQTFQKMNHVEKGCPVNGDLSIVLKSNIGRYRFHFM